MARRPGGRNRPISPRSRRQVQVYRREYREMKSGVSQYTSQTIALAIFFISALTLGAMGNGLLIALGGPILATPFVWLVLNGLSPEEIVSQMSKPPGGNGGGLFGPEQRR